MSPSRVSAKYSTPKSVLYHHKMNLDSGKKTCRVSAQYSTPNSVLYHHKMNLDSGKKPAYSRGQLNTILSGVMLYNL